MQSRLQPWLVVAVLAAALLAGMHAHAEISMSLAGPDGADFDGIRGIRMSVLWSGANPGEWVLGADPVVLGRQPGRTDPRLCVDPRALLQSAYASTMVE